MFDMKLVSVGTVGRPDDGQWEVSRTVPTKKFTWQISTETAEEILRKHVETVLGQPLPKEAEVEIIPSIDWRDQEFEGFDFRVELPAELCR